MQGVNRAQDFTELLGEVKGLKRRAKASLELDEVEVDSSRTKVQSARAVIPQKKQSLSWRQICLSCFFFVLLFGSGFGVVFSAFSSIKSGFRYAEISDPAVVDAIFRSGEPHVVYCVEQRLRHEGAPAVVVAGMRENSWRATTASVDCKTAALPDSGKPVWTRFGFSDRMAPVFFVANREKPSQFPITALQSPEAFSHFIDDKLKRKFLFVPASGSGDRKSLTELCKEKCVVAAYKGAAMDKDVQREIEKISTNFRQFRLLATSAKKLKLKDSNSQLGLDKVYNHQVGLLCLVAASSTPPSGSSDSGSSASASAAFQAGYLSVGSKPNADEISGFFTKCNASPPSGLVTLSEPPTLLYK